MPNLYFQNLPSQSTETNLPDGYVLNNLHGLPSPMKLLLEDNLNKSEHLKSDIGFGYYRNAFSNSNSTPFNRQNETSPQSEILYDQIGSQLVEVNNFTSDILQENLINSRSKNIKHTEQNSRSALSINLRVEIQKNLAPSAGNDREENDLTIGSTSGLEQEDQLFIISPNFDYNSPATTPSSQSSFEIFAIEDCSSISSEDNQEEEEEISSSSDIAESDSEESAAMSSSCNFMYWMSAPTRRRASSVTPSVQPTTNQVTTTNSTSDNDNSSTTTNDINATTNTTSTTASSASHAGRRASSSDDLAKSQAQNQLQLPNLTNSHRSASGNHLSIGASVETICPANNDSTQRGNNRTRQCLQCHDSHDLMQPLDSPQLEQLSLHDHAQFINFPIPLDDILQDEDDEEIVCQKLEEKCRRLEEKVAELEKKRFEPDVPRTLVDNIIHHRKELRDLNVQLYKRNLDSEESDKQSCGKYSHFNDDLSSPSCDELISPNLSSPEYLETNPYYVCNNDIGDLNNTIDDNPIAPLTSPLIISHLIAEEPLSQLNALTASSNRHGKFGSNLKPGQENTADILNAIPPSGQLQHRQYLTKASSGSTNLNNYFHFNSANAQGSDQQHHHNHHSLRRKHHHRNVNPQSAAGVAMQNDYHTDDSSSASSNIHNQHHYHVQQHHKLYQQMHHHRTSRHNQMYQDHQQHISSVHGLRQEQAGQQLSPKQPQQQQAKQVFVQVDVSCSQASEKLVTSTEDASSAAAACHMKSSGPIRPNHFKGEFCTAQPSKTIGHDSSSTTSSSNSPH